MCRTSHSCRRIASIPSSPGELRFAGMTLSLRRHRRAPSPLRQAEPRSRLAPSRARFRWRTPWRLAPLDRGIQNPRASLSENSPECHEFTPPAFAPILRCPPMPDAPVLLHVLVRERWRNARRRCTLAEARCECLGNSEQRLARLLGCVRTRLTSRISILGLVSCDAVLAINPRPGDSSPLGDKAGSNSGLGAILPLRVSDRRGDE